MGSMCASMQQLTKDEQTMKKCIRRAEKEQRKAENTHAKLAEEMGFSSDAFYVPLPRLGRDVPRTLKVTENQQFFDKLTQPFLVEVRDIEPTRTIAATATATTIIPTSRPTDIWPITTTTNRRINTFIFIFIFSFFVFLVFTYSFP